MVFSSFCSLSAASVEYFDTFFPPKKMLWIPKIVHLGLWELIETNKVAKSIKKLKHSVSIYLFVCNILLVVCDAVSFVFISLYIFGFNFLEAHYEIMFLFFCFFFSPKQANSL